MGNSNRNKYSLAFQKKLYQQFKGHCFLCGNQFLQIHHIIPHHITKKHDPETSAAVCAHCHEVITFSPYLFTEVVQLSIKKDVINVINLYYKAKNFLHDDKFHLAMNCYLKENLHNDLIRLGWYHKARELAQTLFAKSISNTMNRIQIVLALGEIEFWLGNHLIGKAYLEKIDNEIKYLETQMRSWFNDTKGRLLSYFADEPELKFLTSNKIEQKHAIEFFDKAIEITNDRVQLAKLYSSKASSLKSLGLLGEAFNECLKGIEITDNDELLRGRETNLDRIASIHLAKKEYVKSFEKLSEALMGSLTLNHKRGIAYRLRSMSAAYLGLGEFESALISLKLGNFFSESISDPNGKWMYDVEKSIRKSMGLDKFEKLNFAITSDWRKYLKKFPTDI
ncbi:MAG: hypothetical protein IH852_14550 [Bacteroidetes bacterium]|nr:hypothetical protein [Bacteroidota bacterium]